MSAFKTSLLLLKIGNGGTPEVFTAIGGFRQYELVINRRIIDATDMEDEGWRALLSSGGAQFLSISGSGVFTNAAAEQQLQGLALGGAIANFQCCLPNGNILQAPFLVQYYSRGGHIEGEEAFRVTIESAGEVVQT